MSGHLENLDPYQKEVLKKFRSSLQDVLKPEYDDRYLLMFLRARSFVKEDAETMIRENFRWRKHFSPDFFMNKYTPPDVLSLYTKIHVLGYDNEGSLVKVFVLGRVDLKGLLKSATSLEIITFLACHLTSDERMLKERNKKFGTFAETVVYIVDFSEISLYGLPIKYTVSLIIHCLKVAEANFPERLKSVILINCPSAIHLVMKVVLPFLSETTSRKIKIFGKDGYRDDLFKIMDSKILPPHLGGTRVDTAEDRTCEHLTSPPLMIASSYYLQNRSKLDPGDDDVHEVSIAKHNFFCVDINVEEADNAIYWEVQIDINDIGIGLFLKDDNFSKENNMKCVKQMKKFKSHFSPFHGHHICDSPGTYVLLLDNRYSYFTDKVVLYRINVKQPFDE